MRVPTAEHKEAMDELFSGKPCQGAEATLQALAPTAAERSVGMAIAALLRDTKELYLGGDDSDSVLVMCAHCLGGEEIKSEAEDLFLEAGLRHASGEDFVWQVAGSVALKAAFAYWRRRPESPILFRLQVDGESVFLPVLAHSRQNPERFLLRPRGVEALGAQEAEDFRVELPSRAVCSHGVA